MLLCAVPALSGHWLASWTPLAVASLAAWTLVNNPSQLQWFILCCTSPLNIGGFHTWAVTFSLGCGGLTVPLESWSVLPFGSHPSPLCKAF